MIGRPGHHQVVGYGIGVQTAETDVPSHSSIITGCTPDHHGMDDAKHEYGADSPQALGYTKACSVWT